MSSPIISPAEFKRGIAEEFNKAFKDINMTNKTEKTQARRDRRKAKQSNWARDPNPSGKIGHHNYTPKFVKGARVR